MGHSTSSGRSSGGVLTAAERAAGVRMATPEETDRFNQILDELEQAERAERAASSRSSTENRVKSAGQISAEITQLNQYPSGTRIEVQDDNGNWATYTAHDEAYTGRNGRMLRRRRYSIVSANTNRRGVPFRLSNRSAPEDIAERPWRLTR